MTFHTGQNPHGAEKSLVTFERHQGSASSVGLSFVFLSSSPNLLKKYSTIIKTWFLFNLFTWSQVVLLWSAPCCTSRELGFQKVRVTQTMIFTRLCRSHCQRKHLSQFPSCGIMKGDSVRVFWASTKLWGCERQAALYCYSCCCIRVAILHFCCRKPYQSDLSLQGPLFLITLMSFLDMGDTQGVAYWLYSLLLQRKQPGRDMTSAVSRGKYTTSAV